MFFAGTTGTEGASGGSGQDLGMGQDLVNQPIWAASGCLPTATHSIFGILQHPGFPSQAQYMYSIWMYCMLAADRLESSEMKAAGIAGNCRERPDAIFVAIHINEWLVIFVFIRVTA